MSKITDYAFLFQKSFGTSGVNAIGSFQLSQLNSSSVQAQLKAAGINTNSKQYKSAVKQMMSAGNGAMYGNIQGIKNLMSHYAKDGDYADQWFERCWFGLFPEPTLHSILYLYLNILLLILLYLHLISK